MELQDAIERHRQARAKMDAYRRAGGGNAAYAALNEAGTAALSGVVDAPEHDEADFFHKLQYLAEFEASKTHYRPPQIWQINGSLLCAIWRRFGWSETQKPYFPDIF